MRISDWSSDVCSSDLAYLDLDRFKEVNDTLGHDAGDALVRSAGERLSGAVPEGALLARLGGDEFGVIVPAADPLAGWKLRSEEHTSELQSLMRISYAVFCLKKKTKRQQLQ